MAFRSTRTRPRSPSCVLSYMHTEESRIVGFMAPASHSPLTSSATSDKGSRELLWLGLMMFAIAVAAMQAVK
jgi:hypothetical protein